PARRSVRLGKIVLEQATASWFFWCFERLTATAERWISVERPADGRFFLRARKSSLYTKTGRHAGRTWTSTIVLDPNRSIPMKRLLCAVLFLTTAAGQAIAQEPVTGANDTEALFTSPDPKLHRNKQAAYHIQRDLLEAGHWELAEQWITERYIQH